MYQLKKIGETLAHPTIIFYSFIALMILVIVGTLSESTLGLYAAQTKYFSSFYFWWGVVPVPSGLTVMTIIFINLAAHFFFKAQWRWEKSGILLSHFGALLLFAGGFVTSFLSQSGSMVIQESETKNFFVNENEVELVIFDTTKSDFDVEVKFRQSSLKDSEKLVSHSLPFSMVVESFFPEVKIVNRETQSNSENIGLLRQFEILPRQDDDDKKIGAGIVLNILLDGEKKYHLGLIDYERLPVDSSVDIGGRHFVFRLQKQQIELPFKIYLISFKKELYPGTEMAKSYESKVELVDHDSVLPYLIKMNQPLRYKSYTFYQSSYIENAEKNISVLAVVDNVGRFFPYVSSLLMCLGLFVHLLLQVPQLLIKKAEK